MPIGEYVDWERYVPGATDAHGNVSPGFDDPVSVGVYGFAPGGIDEPFVPGHTRSVSEPALYTPPGVVFEAQDRVIVRGKLYEVVGDTAEWRHPNGWTPGNVIKLKRVDG